MLHLFGEVSRCPSTVIFCLKFNIYLYFLLSGVWLLLDALLLPGYPVGSAVVSLSLGCVVSVLCIVVQPYMAGWARVHPNTRCLWAVDAMYSYVAGVCCCCVWRSIWNLWDNVLGSGLPPVDLNTDLALNGFISHTIGVSLLLCTGGMRNLSACPLLTSSDVCLPLLGAVVTPLLGTLNPMDRLRAPPPYQSKCDWGAAVGLTM